MHVVPPHRAGSGGPPLTTVPVRVSEAGGSPSFFKTARHTLFMSLAWLLATSCAFFVRTTRRTRALYSSFDMTGRFCHRIRQVHAPKLFAQPRPKPFDGIEIW